MDARDKKFEEFIRIAGILNQKFSVVPVLYGSLGLKQCIDYDGKVNDIDILIPARLLNSEWKELLDLMSKDGYLLINKNEHEFSNEKFKVAFADEENLTRDISIDPKELEVVELSDTKFKVLSAEQYMKVYEYSAKDGYRKATRGKDDIKKIDIIRKYLTK